MTYVLGVDLGTTFTTAAVCEAGREPRMVPLGASGYAVPSVLFLREVRRRSLMSFCRDVRRAACAG